MGLSWRGLRGIPMPYWDISFRASLEGSGNWKNLNRRNYLFAFFKKKMSLPN